MPSRSSRPCSRRSYVLNSKENWDELDLLWGPRVRSKRERSPPRGRRAPVPVDGRHRDGPSGPGQSSPARAAVAGDPGAIKQAIDVCDGPSHSPRPRGPGWARAGAAGTAPRAGPPDRQARRPAGRRQPGRDSATSRPAFIRALPRGVLPVGPALFQPGPRGPVDPVAGAGRLARIGQLLVPVLPRLPRGQGRTSGSCARPLHRRGGPEARFRLGPAQPRQALPSQGTMEVGLRGSGEG